MSTISRSRFRPWGQKRVSVRWRGFVASVADGLPKAEERLKAARIRLSQAEAELEVGWDQQEEYDRIKAELATEDVTGGRSEVEAATEGHGAADVREPTADEGREDVMAEEATFVFRPASFKPQPRQNPSASEVAAMLSGDGTMRAPAQAMTPHAGLFHVFTAQCETP